MKKLNFDYLLTNTSGALLQRGHIKYSISHFIYSLYQKTYINATCTDIFWSAFHSALKNMWAVSIAFATNSPQILNKTSRIGIMKMLHSFGYFAFYDITKNSPIFVKNSNGRVYLVDYKSNQAMSFGFSIPTSIPKNTYSKFYMASFVCNNQNSIVNKDGTFTLKIVDPIGDNIIDDRAILNHQEYKKAILDQLVEPKIYELNFKSTRLKVYISKQPLPHLQHITEYFSDEEIYIYVEELLQTSKYLHFVNGTNLVVSLSSPSIIELTDEEISALKSNEFSYFSDEDILNLKRMKYLVPSNDEFKLMQKKRKLEHSQKKDEFGLTILTTTKCNARCHYCYESGVKQIDMSVDVQKKIINFLEEKATEYKRMYLSWFGGEPLVNTEAIDNISMALSQRNIEFNSSIVSNGYLIDQYIDKFDTWKIESVQITLDGVGDKYNSAKNYIYSDDNAFDRVLKNISLLIQKGIRVAIRLNFNKYNYSDILECIEFIHKQYGNAKGLVVYVNHIFGDSSTYHLDDGTNLYRIMFQKLLSCGYIKTLSDMGLRARSFYCFRTNLDHLVINANGDFYKCEHAIISPQTGCVGNVCEDVQKNTAHDFWTNTLYPYTKCNACEFVFVCQGGCISENILSGQYASCIPFIDSFDDIIKDYYLIRKGEKHESN